MKKTTEKAGFQALKDAAPKTREPQKRTRYFIPYRGTTDLDKSLTSLALGEGAEKKTLVIVTSQENRAAKKEIALKRSAASFLFTPKDFSWKADQVRNFLLGSEVSNKLARASRPVLILWLPSAGGIRPAALYRALRKTADNINVPSGLALNADETELGDQLRIALSSDYIIIGGEAQANVFCSSLGDGLSRDGEFTLESFARRLGAASDLFLDTKREKDELKKLVHAVQSAILRLDADGGVLFANDYVESLFGFTREEITGKNVVGTIVPLHDEQGTDLSKRVKRILGRPGVSNLGENVNFTKTGGKIWLAWTTMAIENDAGEIEEILCVGNDVTEMKYAERELSLRYGYAEALSRFSSRLLSPVVEEGSSIDEAMEILREASGAGRAFLFENFEDPELGLCARMANEVMEAGLDHRIGLPAFERISYALGFSDWIEKFKRGEPIYGSVSGFTPETGDRLKELGAKSIVLLPFHVGDEWSGVIGFENREESRKWSEAEIKLLATAADIIGAYRLLERTQRQIADKERLAAVGKLTGDIAHEIKNPLFAISAVLQTLQRKLERDDVMIFQEGRGFMERIIGILVTESRRIDALVQSLVAYTRDQEPVLVETDLADLLETVIVARHADSRAKNISVVKRVPKVPAAVLADREMMQAAIDAILSNAIHFTPAQGRITMELSETSSGTWVLTASDQGGGVSESDLERIFDPFFSTREEGPGFGLPICRKIMDLHGGSARVRNIKGGAAFSLVLPAIRSEKELKPQGKADETDPVNS